jgi:hypothetical protein
MWGPQRSRGDFHLGLAQLVSFGLHVIGFSREKLYSTKEGHLLVLVLTSHQLSVLSKKSQSRVLVFFVFR